MNDNTPKQPVIIIIFLILFLLSFLEITYRVMMFTIDKIEIYNEKEPTGMPNSIVTGIMNTPDVEMIPL